MWSLSSPGGAALRESDFDFERVLLGLCWDRASWAPAPNKAAGLSTVPRGPCPRRPLPDLTPSSSCSDDPSSARPAGVDAQGRGRRMWAPGLGSKLVSGSARSLYRGLVVQKGGQTGSRQCVWRVRVPLLLGLHPCALLPRILLVCV